MLEIGSSLAFIKDINALDEGLSSLKLHKIKINSENLSIRYEFISDRTINSALKDLLTEYVDSKTPKVFKTVEIDVAKIVTDSELVVNEIYAFVKNHFPSVSMWFEKSDIYIEEMGMTIRYTLSLAQDAKEYFESNYIMRIINEHLFNSFCSTFIGDIKIKKLGKKFELDAHDVYISSIENIKARTFTVSDVVGLDDKDPPTVATYMADATEVGNVVLAGTVTNIREKETKTGKPFYIFDFTDTTAKMSGLYFTRSNTIDKIRSISVGNDIIIRGKLSFYGEKKDLSLTIDRISLCKFPENFVMEELPLKDAPKVYSLISPEPAKTIKISNLFDEEVVLPDEVLSKTYVSVDIETTGTNCFSDAITEIGAVKIENGKITEEWTTLINPGVEIPQKIIDLTGIDDSMVADKPFIQDVIGDFLHFCDGAVLVGQNIIEFDAKFLEKASKESKYKFCKDLEDTLLISRNVLPYLKRYKLNDLADYFGIEFLHHRALSDARATAEIFLELKKLEYKNK